MNAPVVLAWVSALFRYPVKSMQGERVDALLFGPAGAENDRRWAVIDEAGRALSAKTVPELLFAGAVVDGRRLVVTLPDGRVIEEGDPQADSVLSSWLGRPVRLVEADAGIRCRYEVHVDPTDNDSPVVELDGPTGSFRDSRHSAHLLTTASLRAASELHPQGAWEARRFRPNVLIDTDGEGFVEDTWAGARIEAGGACFEVRKPTLRCSIPNRAQPGIESDIGIARALARHHELNLGVYAGVESAGQVGVGDGVSLV